MKTDIFEDMAGLVGCDVSGLPYHKREVWEEIKRQLPLAYPKEQLEKFSHYVFGVDYAVIMGILEMRKGSDTPCSMKNRLGLPTMNCLLIYTAICLCGKSTPTAVWC